MSKPSMSNGEVEGTRWAVLVAGSYGYGNYRHQADVCHAYQLLKNNGLKDDNIVVFMYDDIAFNEENPRPSVIINHPDGDDVYYGVPKGKMHPSTIFSLLYLEIRLQLKGGSGKVVNSGPNDHIFIYYADHGGPGVVLMPTDEELYAKDLIDVLKKKHASGTYKSMVIYLEACESGSMFDGLLPQGLNIYATTASNANESSWGFYCPGLYPPPPPEYETYLGDLFSISWLEDSDKSNLGMETLEKQYQVLRRAPEGSEKWVKAQQELTKEITHRNHLDHSVEAIGEILFGPNNGAEELKAVRPAGQPLVDDWDCLKTLVGTYKQHCGSLSSYGIKHMRAFVNMCNAGVGKDMMAQASANACP
ncbi:hypothetical protein Ancab_002047 [Ancistrocladus abbreviatus]